MVDSTADILPESTAPWVTEINACSVAEMVPVSEPVLNTNVITTLEVSVEDRVPESALDLMNVPDWLVLDVSIADTAPVSEVEIVTNVDDVSTELTEPESVPL